MDIEILGPHGIAAMRRAGASAAATLAMAAARVRAGTTTAQIDHWVREDTRHRGGTPAQLGYNGFEAAVCTSRNEVVCHGIPSTEERARSGDILNIDVTTCLDGYHGDTSRMVLVDEVAADAELLARACQEALYAGISQVRPRARLGDIGAAIGEVARLHGLSVVSDFCGHGIGRHMHMPPQVSHLGRRGSGLRLKTGMAFTIEPMLNLGRPEVRVLDDGWTAVTVDGSLSAQWEHTLLVTETGVEVLTARPEEESALLALGASIAPNEPRLSEGADA